MQTEEGWGDIVSGILHSGQGGRASDVLLDNEGGTSFKEIFNRKHFQWPLKVGDIGEACQLVGNYQLAIGPEMGISFLNMGHFHLLHTLHICTFDCQTYIKRLPEWMLLINIFLYWPTNTHEL